MCHPFQYERFSQPLLPRRAFLGRLLAHVLVAGSLLVASLGLGILGYHFTVGLSWLDALLNASMLLGGMGPVNPVTSPGGKLFASAYALYAGIAFLATVSVLLAPLVHRLLHRLHLDRGGQVDT